MRIALLCSAHGFGHAARQLALAEALMARGHEPTLFSAAPDSMIQGYLPVATVPWTIDVGLVQRDSVQEDPEATRRRLADFIAEPAIARLAAALLDFDRAVVDVSPIALAACRRAGVPALAIGNFDWAWIYRHYAPLQDVAAQFAAWQAPHPAGFVWPGPGMHGFARVRALGLLGRQRPPIRYAERTILVAFGGMGLENVERLLPPMDGYTYLLSPPLPRLDRPDCRYVDDVPYPALVAGADLVLCKPGYSTLAEAMLAGTPMVWLRRPGFPEAPFLETAMAARGDLPLDGDPAKVLRERLARGRPTPLQSDAASIIIRELEEGCATTS